MQNPFMYPGKGNALRQVVSSTNPRPNDADQTVLTIANGEYSEPIGADDCLELTLNIVMASAATGDVTIQRVLWSNTANPPTTSAGETFDVVPFANETRKSWRSSGPVSGHYRVYNGSGTDISALYVQKRIN